jgi:hypothetical protein
MRPILYCTVLYFTILYYTVLHSIVLYYTILQYTILYYTISLFLVQKLTNSELVENFLLIYETFNFIAIFSFNSPCNFIILDINQQNAHNTVHFHRVYFKTQPHTILAPEPLLLPLNLYHIIRKTALRRNKRNDKNSYSTHCLSPFCIKFHLNQHSAIYDLL